MTEQVPTSRVMAVNRVALAMRQCEQQSAVADAARTALHAAIKSAKAAGVRQVDLVACTGYSREHIRRVCGDD